MPDPYIVVLAAFGTLVLVAAWLPMLLHTAPLSRPIASVAMRRPVRGRGRIRHAEAAPWPHAGRRAYDRHVVIVSLIGAVLKLDRVIGWRSWALTWHLLGLSCRCDATVFTAEIAVSTTLTSVLHLSSGLLR